MKSLRRIAESGTIAVKNPPRKSTLLEYKGRRNCVLISREIGGLGDIFMHRMMFEDIKKKHPGCNLHFACPAEYHDAVIDHPYVDKVLDFRHVNALDYCISYNTTTACGRYEQAIAPLSGLHRSDIWSMHCGVSLDRHRMHISLSRDELDRGREILGKFRSTKGVVCLCPSSSTISKNMMKHHIDHVVGGLKSRGWGIAGLHSKEIAELSSGGVATLHGLKIREWMAVIANSDAVISVDTSSFHCAGGLGKPLVGMFTWADGKVYGRYYDFQLVQKHRDDGWDCGPCYTHSACPKTNSCIKPCLTELEPGRILEAFDKLNI